MKNNTIDNMIIKYSNNDVRIIDIIDFALANGLDVLMTVKSAVKAREAVIDSTFDVKVAMAYSCLKTR